MKNYGPMLYAYPDSMGNHLSGTVEILNMQEFKGIFQSFYILPSMYQNDLDRGFCVVRYDLDERVATEKDLSDLRSMNIDLMMDFVVNHASTGSPQFQDIVKNLSLINFSEPTRQAEIPTGDFCLKEKNKNRRQRGQILQPVSYTHL